MKPAYISRVSNQKVLATVGEAPLSTMLAKRQLLLYGRIDREPDNSILRKVTFVRGTLQPIADSFVRKIGRPRAEWTREVGKMALNITGSLPALTESVKDVGTWKSLVVSSFAH